MTAYNSNHNGIATPASRSWGAQGDDEAMVHFNRLVEQQAALSKDLLYGLHKRWLGPQGLFASFGAEIERLGRQAPALGDLNELQGPQRLQEAERAMAFALAQCNRRGAAVNPFCGRKREALCCAVFDDAGGYTLVERYAAYEAIRQGDSDFFIKLIATTRGVVERRIVFRGLLEHFDRLLPIEKSIYPLGYRDVQQSHLNREEGLYGPLQLDEPLVVLLERISPIELLNQVQASVSPLL